MQLPANYSELSTAERRAVRERYIEIQRGKCWYCDFPLSGPPPERITSKPIDWQFFPRGKGFLDYPIHLQHDHETDKTEGAVHAYCNAVLWQYHGR